MQKLTIFTPTYNRANTLPNLYNSLVTQDCQDFIWLIIDDGSNDNTKVLVDNYINEKKFSILYFYKTNGGKHTAFNLALDHSITELFYCVDSDDYIPHNTVSNILLFWESLKKNNSNVAGIIGQKISTDGKLLGSVHDVTKSPISISQLYNREGKKGETALVFLTNKIKEFRYPIYDKEKFIPDGYLYKLFSQKYKMTLTNFVLCVCNYRSDGLTKNGLLNSVKNPQGYSANVLLKYNESPNFILKSIYLANYFLYLKIAKQSNIFFHNFNFFIFILILPIYFVLFVRLKLRLITLKIF